jgi:hypothetical protein
MGKRARKIFAKNAWQINKDGTVKIVMSVIATLARILYTKR